MAPLDMDAPAWKVRRVAASKIQAVVRLKSGANRLLAVARSVYEVGYDAESEDYFSGSPTRSASRSGAKRASRQPQASDQVRTRGSVKAPS